MSEKIYCDVPSCDGVIPEGEEEDFHCFGCGNLVCDDHPTYPMGGHNIEDHTVGGYDDEDEL